MPTGALTAIMIAFAQTPGRAAATAGATRTTPFVSVKKKRSAAAASTTLSSAVPTAEEEEEAREECVLVKSQIKLCEDAVHDDGKEHTVLEIMAATHLGKRVNTCSFVHGALRARPPTFSRPTKDLRLTTPMCTPNTHRRGGAAADQTRRHVHGAALERQHQRLWAHSNQPSRSQRCCTMPGRRRRGRSTHTFLQYYFILVHE